VQESDRKLRDWADTLNDQVDRRTEELRDANLKLEQTYKQLVVSEKLASIGEITAGVAHEINNPVAVIQGNIDLMRMTLGAKSDEHATELNLIDAQVRRITAIVGKLLQFAKPGDFADNRQHVDVQNALEDSIVLVQHSLHNSGISLVRNYSAAPPVLIDQGELQQVLVNLLINAIQAMPDGGILTLTVKTKQRDGVAGVLMRVKDTGTGISAQQLEQVFDPFFTTKRGKGTGLGLSISQSLIRRSGGIITVKSKIDQGSEFFIWLPETPILTGH
jgi:two-component system NtrC family sensor kinase